MTLVQRLLPLALLSFASHDAHGAGNGSIGYASAMPRTELLTLSGSKSRSAALVITLSRRF